MKAEFQEIILIARYIKEKNKSNKRLHSQCDRIEDLLNGLDKSALASPRERNESNKAKGIEDQKETGFLLGRFYKPDLNIFAACYPNRLYWKKDKCYEIINVEMCPITGIRITLINEQGEEHGFPICTILSGSIID